MHEPVKTLIAVRSGERRDALQALLESIDQINTIYMACDAQTAITVMAAHNLALVLTDDELLRAINASAATAVVTLVKDRGEQAHARAAGATHVFMEGTPVSQLIATIEALLENRQA